MWDEVKALWRNGGMLTRLVWVNLAVFLILLTLDIVDEFSGGAIKVVLPAEGPNLGHVLETRRWPSDRGGITHMFTHQGVCNWHEHAPFVLDGAVYHGEVGSRRLLSTYLGGGLAGSAYLVTNGFKLLQNSTYALGASASVMAILEPRDAAAQFEIQPSVVCPVSLKHLFWGTWCWITSVEPESMPGATSRTWVAPCLG